MLEEQGAIIDTQAGELRFTLDGERGQNWIWWIFERVGPEPMPRVMPVMPSKVSRNMLETSGFRIDLGVF